MNVLVKALAMLASDGLLQYCPFCGAWSKPGGGCQKCGKPL